MSKKSEQAAADEAEMDVSGGKESSCHSGSLASRVSIGLPVYNGELYLKQALDSLLRQTFQDFELIICDNASTDHTEQICRSYAARDPRIRYYRNDQNRGASWNFNRTVELARGEYFKWAAHDDICAPEFLQACLSAMDRDPGIVLAYSWTQVIDHEGRPRRNYQSPIELLGSPRPHERFRGAVCQDPSCCYEVFGLARTAVLRQTPMIGRYTGSDRMLVADLALLGRFHEVPAFLFFNREHPKRSIRSYPVWLTHLWIDPKLKGTIPLPHWRWLWEYRRSTARSGLGLAERIRCYAALFPWVRQNVKQLAVDLRVAGMMLIRKLSPRTGELVSRLVHEGPRALFGTTDGLQR